TERSTKSVRLVVDNPAALAPCPSLRDATDAVDSSKCPARSADRHSKVTVETKQQTRQFFYKLRLAVIGKPCCKAVSLLHTSVALDHQFDVPMTDAPPAILRPDRHSCRTPLLDGGVRSQVHAHMTSSTNVQSGIVTGARSASRRDRS